MRTSALVNISGHRYRIKNCYYIHQQVSVCNISVLLLKVTLSTIDGHRTEGSLLSVQLVSWLLVIRWMPILKYIIGILGFNSLKTSRYLYPGYDCSELLHIHVHALYFLMELWQNGIKVQNPFASFTRKMNDLPTCFLASSSWPKGRLYPLFSSLVWGSQVYKVHVQA